jgi:hypothetical protein
MSNAAESLQVWRVSQRAFMVVRRAPLGELERCWEVVGRVKRGRKMASVIKVIVGLEGSRCVTAKTATVVDAVHDIKRYKF